MTSEKVWLGPARLGREREITASWGHLAQTSSKLLHKAQTSVLVLNYSLTVMDPNAIQGQRIDITQSLPDTHP